MFAPTTTATKKANPWQTTTATRLAGSRAASEINLPKKKHPLLLRKRFQTKTQHKQHFT